MKLRFKDRYNWIIQYDDTLFNSNSLRMGLKVSVGGIFLNLQNIKKHLRIVYIITCHLSLSIIIWGFSMLTKKSFYGYLPMYIISYIMVVYSSYLLRSYMCYVNGWCDKNDKNAFDGKQNPQVLIHFFEKRNLRL